MLGKSPLSPIFMVVFSILYGCFISEGVHGQPVTNEVISIDDGNTEALAQLGGLIASRASVPTDLIFVLDATQSVKQDRFHQIVLKFVRDFISAFPLGYNQTRVAVVVFAGCQRVRTEINFIGDDEVRGEGDYSRCSLIQSLEHVEFLGGAGSCLDRGLLGAETILASGRSDAERLVVTLTDGRARGDPAPTAERMRQGGALLVAFGIGNGVNKKELIAIATEDFVFFLKKWEDVTPLSAALTEDKGSPNQLIVDVSANHCSRLCDELSGGCCDGAARCVCHVDTGAFSCMCPPGYTGNGIRGNCTHVADSVQSCTAPRSPPNGQVSCEDPNFALGSTCTFICNFGRIVVSSIVCEVSEDGDAVWTGQTSICQANSDLAPPVWLNCPVNFVLPADLRHSTTMVTWPIPRAVDQFGSRLITTSTQKPPVLLGVGVTEIKYNAVNVNGMIAECSFNVEIIDEEPPLLLSCPADVTKTTHTQTMWVAWDPPRFQDNEGILSTDTNSQANGITASLDAQKEVWYQAIDSAGYDVFCNFTIFLKAYECSYMEPPLHGALVCESWLDGGTLCIASCQEGYTFSQSPASIYVCSESSSSGETYGWRGLDVPTATLQDVGTSWPQCYKKVSPDETGPPWKSIHQYKSPCNTEDTKTVLRKKFLRLFRKLDRDIPGFCGDGCEEGGILVSCGVQYLADAANQGGGDAERSKREVDEVHGTSDQAPAVSRKSNIPSNELVLRLHQRLLNDEDGSLRKSTAPFFETGNFGAETSSFKQGLECEPGQIKRLGVCLKCPLGTEHSPDAAVCLSCKLGRYQDEPGQTSCKNCPPGTTTRIRGSRQPNQCLRQCAVGTYSRTGLQPCVACQTGTFQSAEGATSCQQCPNNRTTPAHGSTSIWDCLNPCSAGTFSFSGNRPCIPCAPGFYQPERGQRVCLPCQDGMTTSDEGAMLRTSCIKKVSCQDFPCQNGGTCITRSDIHNYCTCRSGFTGVSCEININNCDESLCMNGGTCRDGVNGYRCDCLVGFTGTSCETNINDCKDTLCRNGGTCRDEVNGYRCDCLVGITGTSCETNINDCNGTLCRNGGTCRDEVNGYRCDCLVGMTGTSCETNINDCNDTLCLNGGTCRDEVNGYRCDCLVGIRGTSCEININECDSDPCLHGSKCHDGIDSYRCECLAGFNGTHCEVNIDECDSGPCQNGGTCLDGNGEFNCSCTPKFGGRLCEERINLCKNHPCVNNGTCLEAENGPVCICAVGFTGPHCQVDVNDCLSSLCENNSTCVDGVNEYMCQCKSGYSGINCELIDHCFFDPCENAATCVSQSNGFHCSCKSEYTGLRCETPIPRCAPTTCLNGGICVNLLNGPGCRCKRGYTGTTCEINVDDCLRAFCLNGARCVDGVTSYRCECLAGFSGIRCGTNIDECRSNPCKNGATCVDRINSFSCICPDGITGRTCEITPDFCSADPCRNNATCVNERTDYRCWCPSGFTGRDCQINVDDCESAVCDNGGTCVDGVAGYRCHCLDGFAGPDCESNIDDCISEPCRNGATCVDNVNSFTCLCLDGFTGEYCQDIRDPCASRPCLNNGECQDNYGDYFCVCPFNYRGTNCQTLTRPCELHNCTNKGTCEDHPEGPARCLCADGFTGDRCELSTDYCASSPCSNGATCVNNATGFFCECPGGFAGTTCLRDVDECQSGPCQNGGTCQDEMNAYLCNCTEGYGGSHCEILINPCNSSPCRNGGICAFDRITHCRYNASCVGYSCLCIEGYSGSSCETDIDDCLGDPCENGATCIDEINAYSCVCKPGYRGRSCVVNIDDCVDRPCRNGGSCVDGVNDFWCACKPGFTGRYCQTNRDNCRGIHCMNGGTCIDYVEDFFCQCALGFTGELCEDDVDYCEGELCLNGGVCVDDVDGFWCDCAAGFNGTKCEGNVDDCVGEPCQNAAQCLDGINNVTCRCLPGFTGDFCENDYDECSSTPCQNAARCLDGINNITCQCLPGFTGDFCEIDFDECSSSPCKNQALCLDEINGFACICSAGFEGLFCDIDINDCQPQPCLNKGTCVDRVNNFTCDCPVGWSGSSCQVHLACVSNPCRNSGSCVEEDTGFTCLCVAGFSGNICQTQDDDCSVDLCSNGGRCIDGINSYRCECTAGFTGRLCQLSVNDCRFIPCRNGGSCINGRCRCLPGLGGQRCEEYLDNCFSRPCQNGGLCMDGDRDYHCRCIAGFTGKNCQVESDECASAPCLNDGICYDDIESYICECPDGFTGMNCEVNFDDCASNPCLNGAECEDQPRGFNCYCQEGYHGNRCDERVNPCVSLPCLNGGRCTPDYENNTFHCLCRRGYQGLLCEEDIDDCLEHMKKCMNGAVCEDRVDGFMCRCTPGYTGVHCELKLSSDFDLKFGPSTSPPVNLIHVQPDLYELTLSLWIRPEDAVQRGTLLCYVVYNETNYYSAMEEAFSLRHYSDPVIELNGETVRMNFRPDREMDWHHIAFTWESETGAWHFYFDGALRRQGTGLQTGRFIHGGGLLVVGKEHDGIHGQEESSGRFVGRLSQVNLWQLAKSGSEILKLYGSCGLDMGDAMAWPQTPQDRVSRYRFQPSQICRRIDDCITSPCRNGATCHDQVHGYTCDCPDGFNGINCHIESSSCMKDTCLNGGHCFDGPRGTACQCVAGFKGAHCQEALDRCELIRCRNGGSCHVDRGRPICMCLNGYRGPRCSSDINECAFNNGGCHHMCTNTHGSFRCSCNLGFSLQPDGKSCVDSRFCRQGDVLRQADAEWEEDCMHCRCVDSTITCTPLVCFDPVCPMGQEAVEEVGYCCPVCPSDKQSCTIDPQGNFQSFDFYSYRFFGNCRYTMAQDCSTGSFSVHVELERKGYLPSPASVAHRKLAFVYLNGVKIELRSSGVKVNGRFVNLPYVAGLHDALKIVRISSCHVKVTSANGLVVLFGSDGEINVSLPRSYRRKLCGLCGNMNDMMKDDSLTKQQLPSRTVKEFIHSWKVNGYQHCYLSAIVPRSLSAPRIRFSRLPACVDLSYASWKEALVKCDILKEPTFAACREVVNPRRFYELCQQDACSCGGNEPCYCEAIAAYAQECRRNGVIIRDWRNSTVCGIKCPETMIFDDCGPPCIETCFNTPSLTTEMCRKLPCVSRCQCAAGLAYHKKQCILKSTCPNLNESTGE